MWTMAAAIVCSSHAAVAGANTTRAAGIGYLCLTLVMFGCSLAFWTRARSAEGTLYIRWCMVAAAMVAASIGYAPSFTQAILHTPPARVFQTACFNASEALYILAAILFFAGVSRAIVIVDMGQVLLFVVLRFNLMYSPATSDHFTTNHLLIGQLMALFLFLVAMVGCMGAASRAELNFLRMLSVFFGLRLIAFFLANQVSYTWLHDENCGVWDVPGPALLAGFALYLLYTGNPVDAGKTTEAEVLVPSVTVRSLMPSFLALVNLMLGLFVLRVSVPLAAGAISASVACYVVRTVLLQAQAVEERARLQSRNEQLEGLAVRDPLTGIGNRRSLAGVYGDLRDCGNSAPVSLLLIDIDHFKQANDCHGHLHGDNVLITLATMLEKVTAVAPGSECVRLGGDEFALLLRDIGSERASSLAEELRAFFSGHVFGTEKGIASLSIGVASLRSAAELPLETFISYADEALYRAKMLGKNRVEVQPAWQPGIKTQDPATPALRFELQNTAS
jgi:diguanylate cyclase (GGDEF)-like protein